MHFLACFWVESSSTVPSDPFSALPSLFCPLIQRQQINLSDRVVVRASGLELYEHALMDLWFTSWHLVWSFLVSYSMRTADGSEVGPDYRRSSSGRNHMHVWYIRYHKKMPHSS